MADVNKMVDISQLVLSDDALSVIDDGAWIDAAGFEGVKFKVRGYQSQQVRDFMRKKQAEVRANQSGKPIDAEQLDYITREALAEVVLLDWSGLKENDKPLKYSKDLAKQWLTSRNGEQFTLLVIHAAHKVDAEATTLAETLKKTSSLD